MKLDTHHSTSSPAPSITSTAVSDATLPSPAKFRSDIPLSEAAKKTVWEGREAIARVLRGEDEDRKIVVCGPCSIDDVNSALVYAEKLRKLSDKVGDKVLLIMRTYFEKPRSVVGWKGLLYDPLTEGERSVTSGLAIARRLLARINEIGLPCATEFLNPMLALYLEDAISYGSIGSRTVESQIHREFASRLEMPVGMKNGMDGESASALNAVRSATQPHSFFGQSLEGAPCLIESAGNGLAHVILRGGSSGPNYDAANVAEVVRGFEGSSLRQPVLVDCSHGNSSKDHRRQPIVAREVMEQMKSPRHGLCGLMLESNLVEGRQDTKPDLPRVFGQSITDACIGWKDTEALVLELANLS